MIHNDIKKFFTDTETTGTDDKKHGVHQVAGKIEINGKIVEEFDIKFRPNDNVEITQEALNVCQITKEELFARSLSERDAYQKLLSIIYKYINKFDKTDKFMFYAYNASFDKNMLYQMWERNEPVGKNYFFSLFYGNHIDIMSLAGEYLINERSSMPNFKLGTVAEKLGIVIDPTKLHDGNYDTKVMIDIYKICKPKNTYGETINIDNSNSPINNNIGDNNKFPLDSLLSSATTEENATVINLNEKIDFGKHKNQSYIEISKSDPEYLLWLHDGKIRGITFEQSFIDKLKPSKPSRFEPQEDDLPF